VGIVLFQATTHRYKWFGTGIAFMGLVILLGINPISIISVDLLGFIGMIAATLCYGIGSQLSKRLSGDVTIYQITFGTLFCAMVGSGSIALLFESFSFSHLVSPTNISALIGLGVFGSGIAYILFYYMVQKGSPEFATMVSYLVPAGAVIWDYMLLNEEVNWNLLLGLSLILGGVYLSNKKPRRPQTDRTPLVTKV
jgi:drug/metabolite transporter (DMT)-like permease